VCSLEFPAEKRGVQGGDHETAAPEIVDRDHDPVPGTYPHRITAGLVVYPQHDVVLS
jgi:hypothetical protein